MPYRSSFGYVAPGQLALDALTEELALREAKKRQALIDEINRRTLESEIRARDENTRSQATQRAALEDAKRQDTAMRLASILEPGQAIDPETAGTLRSGNLGALTDEHGAVTGAGPLLPGITFPARTTFAGTATQREAVRKRNAREAFIRSLPAGSPQRTFLEAQDATGDTSLPYQLFQGEQEQPVVRVNPRTGKMEQIGTAPKGAHFVNEPSAEHGTEARPYFTVQPVFDAQGRPVGAVRVNARTGEVSIVDVSQLGGQLKPPPGGLGVQTITNEASADQLDRLIDMFNTGAKNLIGPAEGRARAIGQQIPGVAVNQTFADFQAASLAFQNSVIKAITGAQMSEPEARRIKEQIPLPTDKPEVWLAKARQTRTNLQDLENRVRQDRDGASGTGRNGRVRVKAPSGKVGWIPAAQLDAALAQGYTKVE